MTGREVVGLRLVFAGMGASAATVGAFLPALAQRLGVAPASVSLATPVLFAGLLVGVVVAAAVRWRVDHGRLLAAGCIAQALGVLALAAAPSVGLVLGSAGVLGLGFGAAEVLGSVRAAAAPDGAARLTGLTATFAGAAIGAPALVAASLAVADTLLAASVVVALLHVVAAALVATAGGRESRSSVDGRRTVGPPAATAVVLVAYVGAEATLATWAGQLAAELLGLRASAAAGSVAVFWGLLLLGRVVGARALRGRAPGGVLVLALAVASIAVGLAAAVATSAGPVALALAALAVAAVGPVYGTTLALGGRPEAPSPLVATGWLVGVGAVGGSLVPGIVAPVAGAGPAGVLASVAVFLGLAGVAARRLHAREPVLR